MSSRSRFAIWTAAVVALLLGQLVWLFLLRGPRILASDVILIGGQMLLTLPILLIAPLLKTTPADAIKLRRRTSEWIILGGAALLQFAAVGLLRPALSEDVLRYRSDGRMWLDGVSPFATAPLDWSGRDAIDSLVPFANMRTIYPAVSQATFAGAAALEKALRQPVDDLPQAAASEHSPWRAYLETRPTPYRATVFRATFALAAVAMVYVLLLLLRAGGRSAWWAVPVAWNPLVTLEIGGMGHQDIVGVLLVLLCLFALSNSRPLQSAAWLALAAAVKPFALLLAPFALRDAGARRGRAAVVFAAIVLLLYLPPLVFQRGHVGWRQSARTYTQSWEANGSLYELITRPFEGMRPSAGSKRVARVLGAAAVLATAVVAWRSGASIAVTGYWLCLVALLVSPVGYPWYLLWALCFVPLLRGEAGWTALVWSGTIGLSYVSWHQPTWRMSSTMLLAEYGVVYGVLVMELVHATRTRRRAVAAEATSGSPASLFPPRRRESSA